MKEIWKTVQDYEGLYEVSSEGRFKSLERITVDKNGVSKKKCEKILTLHKDKVTERHPNPHYHVELWKDNKRSVTAIHRLVAKAFIPNPEGKPQVNHIDGNPANNNVDNLEWCTGGENMKHAYKNKLTKPRQAKAIKGVNVITGNSLSFASCYEASRYFDVTQGAIRSALKGYGRSKSACGYKWSYTNEPSVTTIESTSKDGSE